MDERELKRRKVAPEEEGENQAVINRLPEELFLFVISFIVPRFPHLLRASLVCRFWNQIISRPSSLWAGSAYFTAASNY